MAIAAAGQPAAGPGDRTVWTVRVAAEEQTVWIAASAGESSVIYRRGINEPFQALEPLKALVVKVAGSAGVLYSFVEDGAFYSLGQERWTRERDLPRRSLPLDLVGDDTGVYALLRSPSTGEMQRMVGQGRTATTAPFDAGEAVLTLARYGASGWMALAPCPRAPGSAGPGTPRLAVLNGIPCLVWRDEQDGRIECAQLDVETGRWHPAPAAAVARASGDFWIAAVNRVPTIVVTDPVGEEGPKLTVLRLLGGLGSLPGEWRAAPLHLSELPAGVEPERYDAVFGFNQHAVMLMVDRSGAPHLQFGRIDAVPTEGTLSVGDVLSGRHSPEKELRWLQGVTLVVLVALLVALFVFRRGAMVAVLNLPEDCALALAIQRLVSFLIDVTPFALLFAAVLGVDALGALRELLGWATGSGGAAGRLPTLAALLWWAASCGSYTVYGAVMEWLTGRTVGKVVLGVRVVSEAGTRARPWQLVVRNVLRCLELMPPFWVLGFVVVLSRNRQRVGDIFARTIVVRRLGRPRADN